MANTKSKHSSLFNIHTLHTQITCVIFGLMAMMCVIFSVMSSGQTVAAAESQLTSDVYNLTRLLGFTFKALKIPIDRDHTDLIQNQLSQVSQLDNSNYAAIYDSEKQLIAVWQRPGDTSFNPNINLTSRPIFNHLKTIHSVFPIVNLATGDKLGYFVYGYDKSALISANATRTRDIIIACIGIMIVAGLLMRFILLRMTVIPILDIAGTFSKIVKTNDLTINIEQQTNEEFTLLGESFSKLMEFLREIIISLKNLSMQLSVVVDDMSIAGQQVDTVAFKTKDYTQSTTESMQLTLNSIYELTATINEISKSGEQGASAIYEMTKVNDNVVQNIHNMNSTIAAARAAVKQNTAGINDIADHIEKLNEDISFTSSSITIMADTVDAIENTTRETAALSEEVTNNATAGVEAIQKTTAGIGAIKRSSEMAAGTISHLGQRINDIGSIIHVIEDITKQTNLLALNAAIIAAQSGENGKSFGVVSEEIAALANRTKSSTREIAELIASIQEESQHAIEAMQEDMGSIEEGVRLGQAAEEILHMIEASANRSTAMVQKIAATTLDQADDIRELNTSIANIARSIKEINNVTTKQASDSNTIQTNINNIGRISQQVLNSSTEQASGTKDLSHSINTISHNLTDLSSAQESQEKDMERAMANVQAIANMTAEQADTTNKLNSTIDSIKDQVVKLNQQIRRFKIID